MDPTSSSSPCRCCCEEGSMAADPTTAGKEGAAASDPAAACEDGAAAADPAVASEEGAAPPDPAATRDGAALADLCGGMTLLTEAADPGPWRRICGASNLVVLFFYFSVPEKVRIFAWRLAREGLATQKKRCSRTLATHATYQLFGQADEDGHHAVVVCTKARALREEMRKRWELPEEKLFRAWHLRNDQIYGDGKATVTGSARFLESYWDSLSNGRLLVDGDASDLKGKRKMGENRRQNTTTPTDTKEPEPWAPPPEGWVKINMDGAFEVESGDALASAGIVIRDSQGHAVLSTWQPVRQCSEAMEAEAEACLVGIQLAVEWVRKPAVVESDCWELIRLLQGDQKTWAAWSTLILEVKAACQLLPEVKYSRVKRQSNSVAHTLAKLAQIKKQSAVWRLRPPPSIRSLGGLESRCGDCLFTNWETELCKNLVVD
ncbi:hypothetical protein PR202_gb23697 [Eleusine coracana subsp. coracana]|uniref:RNase H type-1 domain-containing protein n=1 Tax=Eleusine coracana subsp. coracana TaxID=191504 RepID=A0AAV5FGX7_ELECO|nr:hypothetical protein PR202_gb23697 [Eleusine coracana subsp. coracana]